MFNAYLSTGESLLNSFSFPPAFSLIMKDSQTGKRELVSRARIEDLVVRAQNGDQQAFSQIYQEYVDPVYRFVYSRLRLAEPAEDITQEIFIKALRNIRSYRYCGKTFASWLFRIARNQIIDFQRQSKKRSRVPIIEAINSLDTDDPVASLEQSLQTSAIAQAIENLPPRQKEVISLRFGAEFSISETAEAVGISEGSVKKLQHEAISKLRKLFVQPYASGLRFN